MVDARIFRPVSTDDDHGMDAFTHLMDGIFRLERAIVRIGTLRLTPWNMSLSSYTAMLVIDRNPHLSLAQLSRRCYVRSQTMTRIVAALQERGYVQRGTSPDSERAMSLTLTEEGVTALREMGKEVLRIDDAFTDTLSPDELDQLARMLRVCALRVEKDLRDMVAS